MHSTESRFVIGPSNILFAGMDKCTFQPGNFTGWGSEWVNNNNSNNTNYYLGLVQSMQAVSRSSTLHCNTFYENRIMRLTVPGILSPIYFTSYMPNTVLLLQLVIFVWTHTFQLYACEAIPNFNRCKQWNICLLYNHDSGFLEPQSMLIKGLLHKRNAFFTLLSFVVCCFSVWTDIFSLLESTRFPMVRSVVNLTPMDVLGRQASNQFLWWFVCVFYAHIHVT